MQPLYVLFHESLDNLTSKSYNDSASSSPTPCPSYYYNTAVTYSAFAGLGRPTLVTQTTQLGGVNQSFRFTVAYTASDEISSVTNPWGRTITTSYDPAGRVSGVTGSLNGQNTTYAGSFTYAPHGAVTGMTSGNGMVHGASYNGQLQPSGITTTSLLSGASANLFSLTLGYSGSGLKRLMGSARRSLDSKTFNAAKATWKQLYRGKQDEPGKRRKFWLVCRRAGYGNLCGRHAF